MITNNDMSAVFHALSHESRRKMLDILKAKPGASVGELAKAFDVSRIAVMNHLSVLEKACRPYPDDPGPVAGRL